MPGPYVSSSANNYLGFGKQTVKGTPVAPTVFLPYADSVDLDHGIEGDEIKEGGTGPYIARNQKTKHDPSGGTAMAWRPATAAKLLAWFLGTDTISGAAVPYTHTLTPAETTTYLTAEQNLADELIERFTDAVISKATISGEGGADLMLALEWFALVPGWQTTPTVETYETGISGSTPGGPYRQNEAAYTVDGVAVTNVESWELELEWKFDDDLRLSRVTRAYAPKLGLSGSIKLKQLLLAPDDYRKVNYGSLAGTVADKNYFGAGALVAVYDNGLSATNARVATVTVPNIDWTKATYSGLNPDGETTYLEREGTLKKLAGANLVSVAAGTADAVAY